MQGSSHPRRARFLDPTVGLFVSLYLILLTFFIVMNEISNQQTARAVAAMESVGRAFERPFPIAAKTPGLAAPQDHPAVDPTFLIDAGALVSSVFGPEQATAAAGGNVLRVSLDTHSLFFDDAAQLSEQASGFLDRLAALLNDAPPGMRREAVMLFGRTGEEGSLAAERAARMARALETSGAPANGIAVGLLPERTGRELRMEFRSARLASGDAPPANSQGAGR